MAHILAVFFEGKNISVYYWNRCGTLENIENCVHASGLNRCISSVGAYLLYVITGW